jgi:hypothetical protein
MNRYVPRPRDRRAVMDFLCVLSGGKPFPRWKRMIPLRVRVAWNVLKGNPTIYRVGFRGKLDIGLPRKRQRLFIASCRLPSWGDK